MSPQMKLAGQEKKLTTWYQKQSVKEKAELFLSSTAHAK
jgi:hypothetical protein